MLQKEDNVPTTKHSRYRFIIESLVIWERFSMGINFFAPAAMLPLIIDEFGIDRTTAGALMSLPPLMMVVFLIPGSMLTARIGNKPTYGIGLLLMGLSVVTPFIHDLVPILGLRVLFGIGGALVAPQGPSIVSRWFPSRQIPVLVGVNALVNNVAAAIAVAGGAYLAEWFGWRLAFAIFATVPILGGITWFILAREGPASTVAPAPPPRMSEMLSLLKHRYTLLLGVLLFGPWGENVALNSWLPVYYNKVMGLSLSTAGAMVSLIPLFGIAGSLLGGVLPVRLGLRRPLFIVPGGLLAAFAFATFLAPSQWIILVSIAACGLLGTVYVASAQTLPLELPGVSSKQAGVMLAAAYAIGNAGSFVAPLIVGFLADQTSSYQPGLALAALLPLTLVVCGYLLPETGPKAARAKAPVEAM